MPPLVVAVASSSTHSFSKTRQSAITVVAGLGVEGDAHCGVTVKHRSRVAKDPTQPNLRQVHLIHGELFSELGQQGFTVQPSQLGENITTRDIDLFALSPGTRLHLGDTAVIELTGYRVPCNQLDGVDPKLLTNLEVKLDDGRSVRRAGVMAIVLEGGTVRPNDAIRIVAPAGAAATAQLEPV